MVRPCVYLFLKDGVPLYIGSSANGLVRFACPNHHRRGIREVADDIQVIWCSTTEHARELEQHLIRKLHPKTNGRGKNSPLQVIDDLIATAHPEYYGA